MKRGARSRREERRPVSVISRSSRSVVTDHFPSVLSNILLEPCAGLASKNLAPNEPTKRFAFAPETRTASAPSSRNVEVFCSKTQEKFQAEEHNNNGTVAPSE